MQSYQANALVFPGQSMGPNGVAPLVNYSLGLFNLSGRPLVKLEAYEPFPTSFDEPATGSYYYSVDENAVFNLIQRNPTVFNSSPTGASLQDFKVEILVPDVATDSGYYPGGTKETIGTHTVYAGSPDINISYSGYGGAAEVVQLRWTV